MAAVAVVASLVSGCSPGRRPAPPASAVPLAGGVLVERTPAQLDADLRRLRGRVVVVNFWASWCVPCRTELPALQRVSRAFAGRPVSIIGVDASDERPAGLALLRELGVTFPTVFDRGGRIMRGWGVASLPETRFFATDGTLAGRERRGLDDATLRERVEELLAS
ncbi:MAG TPA: TlpA disulfide reductase family protein [Actinomycetes bacterium]|nr:TlpA disulfide reductase family protein [Actinomycetes bacterium]